MPRPERPEGLPADPANGPARRPGPFVRFLHADLEAGLAVLAGNDFKVWVAVYKQTWGRNRLSVSEPFRFWSHRTGIPEQNMGRHLERLEKAGAIEWTRGQRATEGQGATNGTIRLCEPSALVREHSQNEGAPAPGGSESTRKMRVPSTRKMRVPHSQNEGASTLKMRVLSREALRSKKLKNERSKNPRSGKRPGPSRPALLPESLGDLEPLRSKIADLIVHRERLGKPYTRPALQNALNKLDTWGLAGAGAAIQRALADNNGRLFNPLAAGDSRETGT